MKQSEKAKVQSEISSEKEQLQLAMTSMNFKKETDLLKRKELFKKYLFDSFDENNTEVYINGEGYTVYLKNKNRVYTIDESGNIAEENPNIVKQETDEYPGQLEQIETNQYVINSIEDLVAFSKEVNSGNSYLGNTVLLGKTLDFKFELSYNNINTKYKYDELSYFYVEDNSSTKTLYELCNSDKGFIPIGYLSDKPFRGIFNGNNNEIKNLFINNTGVAGLFGYGHYDITSYYCNITVTGNITSKDNLAAGIAVTGAKFINCHNKANIIGGTSAGGIVCKTSSSLSNNEIDNCSNEGKIISKNSGASGICKYFTGGYIKNCYNTGDISASGTPYYASGIDYNCPVAGIVSDSVGKVVEITNCYNTGSCASTAGWCSNGGIVGNSSNTTTINNCYNIGKIISTVNSTRWNIYGIGYGKCNNCYNIGILESSGSSIFAINGGDINNCYYSSLINTNITTAEENLVDISTKSGQEFVNELNSYIKANQDEVNTTNWAKWILGSNGYPILDLETIWNGSEWIN